MVELQREIPKHKPELREEELSHAKKIERVLKMFGSEKAKENFLSLIDRYYEAMSKQKQSSLAVKSIAETERSNIHNELMEIIQALAVHAKEGSEEEKILREFADRHKLIEAIDDWIFGRSERKRKSVTKAGRFREEI